MKKLGSVLSLTMGLGVAVALVGHFNPGTTRAVDIEQVKVINSASNPVPVTGSVKASQSGTWNVGINGTPTVNVASAPPVSVNFPSSIGINGTVPVQNAPGLIGFTPFIVQDFENPARFAFQASCGGNGVGSATCGFPIVPTTKALVIETVSANVNINSSAPPLMAYLTTTAAGVEANHFFMPTLTGNFGGNFFYTVNATVRIYADPGSSVGTFITTGTTAGSPTVNWTISGHFVCKDFQQLC